MTRQRQYQRSLDISERLGDQDGLASTYYQLGALAHDRGDYDEAERQNQRALDIRERLGNKQNVAICYAQFGCLAFGRGDHDEAERQYQRAFDVFEQLGDQDGLARTYLPLGILAQIRKNFDEAERRYQRALDICERLGSKTNLAIACSQMGILEAERGSKPKMAIAWHVRALAIRLPLSIPEATDNLRLLALHRDELGARRFSKVLKRVTNDSALTEVILSHLERTETADSGDESMKPSLRPDPIRAVDGSELSAAVTSALQGAASRLNPGEPLDTCRLFLALETFDIGSEWQRLWIETGDPDSLASLVLEDPEPEPDGTRNGVPLTGTCTRALEVAALLCDSYDLWPMPIGALALGLVADPESGAAQALRLGGLGHAALIDLLQEIAVGLELDDVDSLLATLIPPHRQDDGDAVS